MSPWRSSVASGNKTQRLRYARWLSWGVAVCLGMLLLGLVGSGERLARFRASAAAIHKSAAQPMIPPSDRQTRREGVALAAAEMDSDRVASTVPRPSTARHGSPSLTDSETQRATTLNARRNSGPSRAGSNVQPAPLDGAEMAALGTTGKSPPLSAPREQTSTPPSLTRRDWNRAESFARGRVDPPPDNRPSDKVDQLLAALEDARIAFVTRQRQLQQQLADADEWQKEEIRTALQQCRELILEEQRTLRERLQRARQTPDP